MASLIIFIKNPELGKVKTRIARETGEGPALDIYTQLLAHTNMITCDLPINKYLYFDAYIPEYKIWEKGNYHFKLQSSGDLGHRMLMAFRAVAQQESQAEKNKEPTIIIGSDTMELNEEIIFLAYQKLVDYDIVIGPASDGGYYLLGFQSVILESLFMDMPWSNPKLLEITLEIIEKEKNSLFLLPQLNDIDTLSDWENYKRRNLDEKKQ